MTERVKDLLRERNDLKAYNDNLIELLKWFVEMKHGKSRVANHQPTEQDWKYEWKMALEEAETAVEGHKRGKP